MGGNGATTHTSDNATAKSGGNTPESHCVLELVSLGTLFSQEQQLIFGCSAKNQLKHTDSASASAISVPETKGKCVRANLCTRKLQEGMPIGLPNSSRRFFMNAVAIAARELD